MSAIPQPQPRLMTVDQYLQLGEDESGRTELQEGSLVVSPRPFAPHMVAVAELYRQLHAQAPSSHQVVPEVDIDLQLSPANEPGTVRAPDLVVVTRTSYDAAARERRVLRASETVLAVEILSLGSRRMDRIVKREEYAAAGIPNYWIVELDGLTTLYACTLSNDGTYRDVDQATGVFAANAPFALRIDLDSLA